MKALIISLIVMVYGLVWVGLSSSIETALGMVLFVWGNNLNRTWWRKYERTE